MCAKSGWSGLLLFVLPCAPQPARAPPKWSREDHVTCRACHNVAPRLNEFGLAFRANFFNWPGGKAPKRDRSLKAFPISVIAELSLEDNGTEGKTTANSRVSELFAANGRGPVPGWGHRHGAAAPESLRDRHPGHRP